ncbi:MAG: twin-arginine translocation signal domain-containing protein, partial [Anaerolineales bacterium]|nr:twin-arginine translocation signal domain-containing protein [Anaerolineales bacterium]
MKKRKLSRRDFLKLAGVGTAVVVPTAIGVGAYRSALGEFPPERSPYVQIAHTKELDGSVHILLIVDKDSSNPFGMYFTEILRAEGVNCFHTTDLSMLQPASLKKYDVAILAESSLTESQAEMIEAYVMQGGRLVGMKPDNRLESVFGLKRSEGT